MHIGRFTPSPYDQRVAGTSSVAALKPVTAPPAVRPAATDRDEGAILGDVPPAPTPEARAMVDKAAQRVEQLHARNRELHFTRDEATNRVVIEVRDLDGNVLKTIPPSKALDIMSGADL
jgi:flagellar protein FlaG